MSGRGLFHEFEVVTATLRQGKRSNNVLRHRVGLLDVYLYALRVIGIVNAKLNMGTKNIYLFRKELTST